MINVATCYTSLCHTSSCSDVLWWPAHQEFPTWQPCAVALANLYFYYDPNNIRQARVIVCTAIVMPCATPIPMSAYYQPALMSEHSMARERMCCIILSVQLNLVGLKLHNPLARDHTRRPDCRFTVHLVSACLWYSFLTQTISEYWSAT